MRTIVVPAVVLTTLTLLLLSRAAGQSAEDDTPAVAASRKRQEAVKTAYIEFRRTDVYPKGSHPFGMSAPLRAKNPWPPEDLKLESVNRVMLDGDKFRFENNHPVFVMNRGLADRYTHSAFNGSVAAALYPKGPIGNGGPELIIRKNLSGFQEVDHDPPLPIWLTLRGLHPALGFGLIKKLKPSGLMHLIDGEPCEEYTIPPGAEETYWLDPAKNYVVRRILRFEKGRLSEQLDVRYHRHETCGWIPESWDRVSYSATGAVHETTRVEMLDVRPNEPQPAEQFSIQFAPGYFVSDYREALPRCLEVQPDGSMLQTYPTPEMMRRLEEYNAPWYWRYRWLLGGFGVVCAGLALLVARRMWRARSPEARS
jgi:hypothetical protein